MDVLRQIAALFTVEVDSKPLDTLTDSIKGAKQALTQLSVSLAGGLAIRGLRDLVQGTIDMGAAITFTASKLGVGTQEFQEFSFAATQMGVSSSEVATSFKFLERNIGEAAEGVKSPLSYFTKFGVKFKDVATGQLRPVIDIIEDIADVMNSPKFKGKEAMETLQFMGRGGNAMVPLFKQGSKGMHSMYEEAKRLGGIMDADLLAATTKTYQELNKLDFAVQGVKNRIVAEALPSVEKFTEGFINLAISTQKWLSTTDTISTVVAGLGVGFAALLPTFMTFAIPAGIFAAMALFLGDIYGWLQGEDSVTGDWLKTLYGTKGANDILHDTRDTLREINGNFKDLGVTGPNALKALGVVLEGLYLGVVQTVSAFAGLIALAGDLFNLLDGNWEGLGEKFKNDLKLGGGPLAKMISNGMTEAGDVNKNTAEIVSKFNKQNYPGDYTSAASIGADPAAVQAALAASVGGGARDPWGNLRPVSIPAGNQQVYEPGPGAGTGRWVVNAPINITLQGSASVNDAHRVGTAVHDALDEHTKNAAGAVGAGY